MLFYAGRQTNLGVLGCHISEGPDAKPLEAPGTRSAHVLKLSLRLLAGTPHGRASPVRRGARLTLPGRYGW